MQTIYNVLSTGKELEGSFTIKEQADACVWTGQVYMAVIETEEVSEDEFLELQKDEQDYTKLCKQWGEWSTLEQYQFATKEV